MKFSLKENFLLHMNFSQDSVLESFDEKKMQLESENNGHDKEYYIDFKLKAKIKEGYNIECVFRSVFILNESVNSDILDDKKLEIMCCTVAYPYFRAYITNFTTMSGFNPVILTNINFFAVYEREISDKKKS